MSVAHSQHVQPRLFHGGYPGLRPGDRIEPGHERGPKRRELAELAARGVPLAARLDPPTFEADRVYLTPSRSLATTYAHRYPLGDLYEVAADGDIERSREDAQETYTAKSATVVAVVRRRVKMPPHKLRQAAERDDRAWRTLFLAREVMDDAETSAVAAGPLYSPGPAAMSEGSTITPATQWGGGDSDAVFVTDSPARALARAGAGQVVYQVRPIGRLMCVRRDGIAEGGVPAARVQGASAEGTQR